MTLKQCLTLVMVAIIISFGQISIKHGTQRISDELSGFLPAVLLNIWIMLGLCLYALAMIIWIWAIKTVPLHVATPISAITFIMIPLFSSLLLGEELSISTFIGSAFIILGIYLSYMDIGK